MNEAKITSKKAFTSNQVWCEGNHENSNNKKALFCRFLTNALTLRSLHTYIYFSEHSLVSPVFTLAAVVFS